jgi:hypothetical protein
MHQFDLWWWNTYGRLTRNERRQRRRRGLGHPILTRYADDWVRHEARYVHGARAPTIGRRVVSLSP